MSGVVVTKMATIDTKARLGGATWKWGNNIKSNCRNSEWSTKNFEWKNGATYFWMKELAKDIISSLRY